MKVHLLPLRAVASALDRIEVAMCLFDAEDRTVLWNDCFLRFFPEHAGQVHAGELYAENLRRFYRHRLAAEEMPELERYVAEGVERHHAQQAVYEFDHHGARVRVSSVDLGALGRVRFWRKTQPLVTTATVIRPAAPQPMQAPPLSAEAADALASIADGVLLVDGEDRALWANQQFFDLLGLPSTALRGGRRADELYEDAWRGALPAMNYRAGLQTLKDRRRFSGAPYELALPRDRWVRVVERRGASADGRGYFSYVDITTLKRQQAEMQRLSQRLELLSVTDPLTGLANRRCFDENLAVEWRRATRDTAPLSLLMIDVDQFKALNDQLGHVAGDAVLRQIGARLGAAARRAGDVVARYGGEEFAMLLPHTPVEVACALAETIRQDVQDMDVAVDGARTLRVTVSIGVGATAGAGHDPASSAVVERADAALYEAKRTGRNRVVCG